MVLAEFATPLFEKPPEGMALPPSRCEIRESKHGHEVREVACLWNAFAERHHLPEVRTPLAEAYKSQAMRRLEDPRWLSAFKDSLEYMATDPFFLGKNQRRWKANLTYALRPKTAWDLSQRLAERRSKGSLGAFGDGPSLAQQMQELGW